MRIPELKLSDRRTIFRILIAIMRADNVIDEAEAAFIDSIFKQFELGIEEFDHMEMLDIDLLAADFATLDREVKDYAKTLFMLMAECDGHVDQSELDIIDRLQ